MRRFVKGIIAAVTVAVLITGMIAVSTRTARAQQNNDNEAQYAGAHGAVGAAAQPDKTTKAPPIDVNGCWTGTMSDMEAGSGSGYLNFNQATSKKGPVKKLKRFKSVSTHNIYVVWSDGSCAFGFGPGTATATGFHEKLNAGGKCRITVIGNISGNDLAGSYSSHGCPASFGPHAGSVTLTFDSSGNSCNIPNACQ